MMFSSAAFYSALALMVTATDARSLNVSQIQSHLNKVNSVKLLRNARQLDEQQQDEDNDGFEMTGDYSVKFNECLTLNVLEDQEEQNDDNNDGNVNAATSIVDYVILDVISSYDGSVKQFSVDLVTFVTTLANYIPDQMGDYCEACDYDYCIYGGDDQQQNQDADNNDEDNADDNEDQDNNDENQDDNGDRKRHRRMEEQNGKIVYTDCDTCNNLSCFDEQDGNNQDENGYSNEDALEWLLDVGECQEIDEDNYNYQDANGYQLYAGYTCNSDGTGMDIGVFADEDCSILTTTTFAEVVESGGYGASYQSMSSGLVHRVFQQYFDCMNTEYVNPNEDQDDQDDQNDEDEDDQFEANEYCQELIEEGAVAMDEGCMDEDEDGDGENNYQYDENGNPWGQYTDANGDTIYYDVQDAEDEEQVCVAIQGKNGDYSTATDGSSNLYDYSNTKNINNDDEWAWDSGKEGQNDLAGNSGNGNGLWSNIRNKVHNMADGYGFPYSLMWAIVAAFLLIGVVVLLFIVRLCSSNKKKAKLSLDDSDDAVTRSRREPLVNNPEVYVA